MATRTPTQIPASLSLAALCICALPAWGIEEPPPAQADAPKTLSLAEAKRTALERNWDLLAAKSDIDIAEAQRIVAGELPNPTLSISTSKIDTARSAATRQGSALWNRGYDTVVAVSELIEIGGKRKNRKASADAGIAGAKARFADASRLLEDGVAKAYIAAALAETNAAILRQSADSLRREAEIAGVRLKAGDISASDKAQIEIAAERFDADARTAESATNAARIAVEILLAEPDPRGEWRAADSLDALAAASAEPEQAGAPSGERADLLAAEAALKKSECDLNLQKGMRIPDPTIQLQFEHEPPDQSSTVGIGFSIPLPIFSRNRGGIQMAEAARTQAQLQVEKTRAQTQSDVAAARVALGEAMARWRDYNDRIEPKSDKVRETVTFAYEKGGATLLDLLSAQRNDNDVRLATAKAMADAASAAADLAAALGAQSQSQPPSPEPPKG